MDRQVLLQEKLYGIDPNERELHNFRHEVMGSLE